MQDAIQLRTGQISQPPFISYIDGPLQLVAPPVGLPIDLSVAQAQCRIDADIAAADAAWLTDEITRARDTFEREASGRQLLAAEYILPVKTWWGGWSGGVPGIYGLLGLSYGLQCSDGTLRLPRAPLMQLVSISFYDATDTLQVLPSSNYVFRTPWKQPGEIGRAPLAVWPPLSPYRQYPIQVQFVGGFAVGIASVSTTGSTITVNGPVTYAAGQAIQFSNSGGALPAPLAYGQTYYVINPTNGGLTFQVSLTNGGAAITLISTGSGTNYVGEIPPDARKAILMMVGHAYRFREPSAEDAYLERAIEAYSGREQTGGYA